MVELRNSAVNKAKCTDLLKEENLVLIGDKQCPRQVWGMTRIRHLYNRRDGKVHSCSLQLPGEAEVNRPVQMLYPLEVG